MAPTDDEILEKAAIDGSLDYSKWPALVEQVLAKLDHNVYNEFPMPTIPLPRASSQITQSIEETPQRPLAPPLGETPDAKGPQSSDIEATQPLPPSSPPLPQSVIPNSQPAEVALPSGSLPPQLLAFYSAIQSTIKASFPVAPPFTVQRLSELVLRPRAHYKTLPSYLRALDRIVSVSSTADTFPLPVLIDGEGEGGGYLAPGTISQADDFNGAALTRIPWLKETTPSLGMSMENRPLGSDLRTESTSMIDGPNGAGSIETVTVNVGGYMSTTQADLARQQDQSADNMEEDAAPDIVVEESSPEGAVEEQGESEPVHARGPEEIGMEDMGPQTSRSADYVFDAETALGRPGEAEKATSPAPQTAKEDRDADGDTVVADVEGQESKAEADTEAAQPSE